MNDVTRPARELRALREENTKLPEVFADVVPDKTIWLAFGSRVQVNAPRFALRPLVENTIEHVIARRTLLVACSGSQVEVTAPCS